MTQNHWTKERCIEEALKYQTRAEFQKNSKSAYHIAMAHSFIDEITSHMKTNKKPKGYWTYQRCLEEAMKYKTLKEFREKSHAAYNVALKNSWDVTSNLITSQATYTRYEHKIKDLFRLTAEAKEKHIPGVKVIYLGYYVTPDMEENEIGFEGYHNYYVRINNKWCYFEKGYTMIEKDGKPFKQTCYHYQKENEAEVRYVVSDYINDVIDADDLMNEIFNSPDSYHEI
jgi:hypothetical protein